MKMKLPALAFALLLALSFGSFAVAKEASIRHIDAAFFAKALGSEKPVLIEFDATWCPFCRAFNPVIEAYAAEKKGAIEVYSVDSDDESDLARQYEIESLPTLILFKNGVEIARHQGAPKDGTGKSTLGLWVDTALIGK